MPLTLNVAFCFPSYGGNGGVAAEHPAVRQWYTGVCLAAKKDPRIGKIFEFDANDTPITMVRNDFVLKARAAGADVLVMIDSDMQPDCELKHDSYSKPWWDTSFDFLYKHWAKGPCCVAAPYGGPPPGENVYVFQWGAKGVYGDETKFDLRQYTREEATMMSGIQEAAALPTGLIMYDMRCFELTEPSGRSNIDILNDVRDGKISPNSADIELRDGWFYYEWPDQYAAQKASTEDVTQTRDLAQAGWLQLGYNPVFCNWDAWAAHIKPWAVRKPRKISTEFVGSVLRDAVNRNRTQSESVFSIEGTIAPGEEVIQDSSVRDLLSSSVNTEAHLKWLEDFVSDRETEKGRKLNIIEIGSFVGDSAIAMAKSGSNVMCVDTWEGSKSDQTGEIAKRVDLFDIFLEKARKHPEISWVRKSSQEAAEMYGGSSLGFFEFHEEGGTSSLPADIIFIDAEHTAEAVLADIKAWLPHLADDGVMIGHDYRSKHFPGMTVAVDSYFGGSVKGDAFLGDSGGFWIVEKEEFLNRTCASNGKCDEVICG